MDDDGGRRRRVPTRYVEDPRVVLTLDAGGTNLVFCAVQGEREIVPPVTLSSSAGTIDEFLQLLITGFRRVHDLSLIHISEPTRLGMLSSAVFCLKNKNM